MNLFVAVPPEELQEWDAVPLPGIEVAGVEFTDDGDLKVFLTESGEQVETPVFFAMACLERANYKRIEVLARHANTQRHFANSKLLAPIEDPAQIPSALLSAVAETFGRFVAELGEMSLAHAETRVSYERLHARFSRLETFIQRGGIKLLSQRLELQPDTESDGSIVRNDLSDGVISQLLPTASAGVAVIELNVKFATEDHDAALRAALYLNGGRTPVASWRITAADVPSDGWITLGLRRALDTPSGDLVLRLETVDTSPARILVALSTMQPNQAYCLRDLANDRPATNRPAAIRIWEAPAGLRVPISAAMIPPEPITQVIQGGNPEAVRIPAPVLRKVRSASDDSWAEGFEAVSFDVDDEAICIHPPSTGVTVGVLDKVVALNGRSVSATAYIANEQSKPVEFGIAVVDPEKEDTKRLLSPSGKAVAWSGWTRVVPGHRQRLTALLHEGLQGRTTGQRSLTLALITRMAEGADNGFAWARIADVTIEQL